MKKEEFFREGRDCAEVSAVPPEGVVKLIWSPLDFIGPIHSQRFSASSCFLPIKGSLNRPQLF